jgi:tryptophan synthase alpha chain
MNRYAAMFERLSEADEGAFVPFLVLGDPTPRESLEAIAAVVRGGADALELGIPFSDPVADGPTIQAADQRALAAGTRPRGALALVAEIRAAHPALPIGLLVYANLVEAPGRDAFYRRVAEAGVDSVLVADAPTLEAAAYVDSAMRHGIDPVLIATPNASEGALRLVARLCRGYTYVVSRAGVTGVERQAGLAHQRLCAQLADLGAPPSLLGFGISTPAQVRAAIEGGAAGAISGSAVVALVERHLADPEARALALEQFTRSLKAATLPG